jgi:RsiW-degrading membrane proteinase PrsW (M82 family)
MAVFTVNLLAASAWLGLLVLLDPNRRRKATGRILLECSLIGLTSAFLAVFIGQLVSIWMPLKDRFSGLTTVDWLVDLAQAGPVEELAKFLIFWLLIRPPHALKEPLDGVLQAASVALGFAAMENFSYGVEFDSVRLVLFRSLVTTTGHVSYAAIWGLFAASLRFKLIRTDAGGARKVLLLAVLGSALLHSFYNMLLAFDLVPFAYALDAVSLGTAALIYRSLVRQSPFRAASPEEPRRAIRVLLQAWRNGNDSPALHLRLALAYLALGELTPARRHLDRCRVLQPDQPQVEALIGCVLILEGRIEAGEAMLGRSYALLGPRGRWALRRTVGRLLARRAPPRGSRELAYRFFLHHFFQYAGSRP